MLFFFYLSLLCPHVFIGRAGAFLRGLRLM
nr:MAG TPA: hypothetical protein [Caudoviricetes sp.]